MSHLSRREWGDHLFEAVFRSESLDPGDSVRVINVTPRFVASAVPASAIEDDDPVGSFCHAFAGISEDEALELFDPVLWIDRLKARPNQPPEFFTQLYLACVVASATEDTHGQGQFQQRLSTLLGLPERDYLIRHARGLPRLWRAVAEWLDEHGAAEGYRGLQVPSDDEVGGETRIGHTKILSFPGYRDQEWLAKAAADHHVDVNSPPRDVLAAMRAVEPRLTTRTQREYRVFVQELVGGREFEHTPFWAAFEATSWRPEDQPGARATLSLLLWRIESDLKIEFGIRGIEDLPAPWSMVEVPESEWQILRNRGVPPNSDVLSANSPLPIRLGAYPRQWREGCLVMVEGDVVPWVSHLGLSPGDRSLLLVKREYVAELAALLTRSVEPDHRPVSVWGADWEALGPLEPGDWMQDVAESSLAEHLSALSIRRYGGVGPRLRGGVRTEIGWLVNEATAPVLKSRARDVTVEVNGQAVGSLTWNQTEKHFAFPRDLRVELRRRTEGVMVSSVFAGGRRVLQIAPCVLGVAPQLPSSLLLEGDQGQLCRLGASSMAAVPLSPELPLRLHLRKPANVPTPTWTNSHLDQAASALLEAVLGATCAAPISGLSYNRMREFLDNALPDGTSGWVVLNELISNGHLCAAMSPHSPAVAYRAKPVSAALRRSMHGAEARLLGLIGQSLRTTLTEQVEARNGKLEVAVASHSRIPGATRIIGLEPDTLQRVLADAEIPVVQGSYGPLARPDVLWATCSAISTGSDGTSVDEWTGRGWSEPKSTEEVRLTRRRSRDRPAVYTVHVGRSDEWRTQARQWACWVWAAACGKISWDGSVVFTPQPPPRVVAEWALLNGNGWCGHSSSLGSWVAFLGTEAGRSFLSAWMPGPQSGSPQQVDPSRQWVLSRLRGWRSRYHPLLHRYGVLDRDERGVECG